ncbi:ATP-binding protein [Saccharothrix sp. ALI-22-I]|uniref:ATP-binding protein n=1 Tax=Saccharothrix sp. ALI-22-I TaxID=1933778 RepID=UPI00117B69E2|nr:LuxR C-terminal-related transcriptional regulator [Saccharothrix sp. ALI-22-I]
MTVERVRGSAGDAADGALIGRRELVAEVVDFLMGQTLDRVVTLFGTGGVGKTAVAEEAVRVAARQHQARLEAAGRDPDPGYIAVASLADIEQQDEERLHCTVQEALRITNQGTDRPLTVIVNHLKRRGDTLLVLDNCDDLLDEVADLVEDLLDDVPGLRVLATSRGSLNIGDERVVPVPPLSLAPGDCDCDDRCEDPRCGVASDAERLLVKRLNDGGLPLDSHYDWDSLGELVAWTDGLPLALELVAVRLIGGMAPRDVLERLDDGRLLNAEAGGRRRSRRGLARHHRKLEETINLSWRSVTPQHRRLLARISAFAGSVTFADIEAVCADGGNEVLAQGGTDGVTVPRSAVVDLVQDLIHQSLLERATPGRVAQLVPLRQYGRLRLIEDGEYEQVRTRHARYFRDLAKHYADTWFGPREVEILQQAFDQIDNFRAALDWCADPASGEHHTGLEILYHLARLRLPFFHALLGEWSDGFEKFLDLVPVAPTPERIGSTTLLGWIRLCQGQPDKAEVHLRQARELAAMTGQPADGIAPLVFLEGAWLMLAVGTPDCIDVLGRAVDLFGQLGPEYQGDRANFLLMRALGAGFWGDDDTGVRVAQTCLEDAERAGARWAISWAQWARGLAPLMHERPVEATKWFRAGLETQIELGEQWGSTWGSEACFWSLAAIAGKLAENTSAESARDVAVDAATLMGGALAIQHDTNVNVVGLAPFRRQRERARDTLTVLLNGEFEPILAQGAAMPAAEVHRLALTAHIVAGDALLLNEQRYANATWSILTGRQQQITALVAEGLTNRQIARRLHVSESTVEQHLTSTYRALGVPDRWALVEWMRQLPVKQLPVQAP